MKQDDDFVLGIDFGTDSVRALLVDAHNGKEIGSAVAYYPRWQSGLFCNPNKQQFRQHPRDYLESLEKSITECVARAGQGVGNKVRAISIDTTGSTPVAVDKSGIPLSLLPEFEGNPNAMFVLWKDHSAFGEAAAINQHATRFAINYLQFVGGIYSSEWFWAKLLHILRTDEQVRRACYSWVEHCDWIPFLLTGGTQAQQMKRGVCAAGHKALWADSFGGLPPEEFFVSLDPLLEGFRSRLYENTYTADQAAGLLCPAWSERLRLNSNTIVGIGAFDAHMGAVGGQIRPYYLSKVMGTSTCDMLVAPTGEIGDRLVKGICGQVPGSIIPGMLGMEAGQSAFGDAYAWFGNLLLWPMQHLANAGFPSEDKEGKKLPVGLSGSLISLLSEQASLLPLDLNDELALDWFNGRRTPNANQELRATLTGLDLGTDPPRLFRAIAESTCFGAKAIIDCFCSQRIDIKGLIGLGGVAKKSPFIMQMLADVLNMPIQIHRSEQTCAMGAAMFASVTAGLHKNVEAAMDKMGQGFDCTYNPDSSKVMRYKNRYEKYTQLSQFIEASDF